MLAPKKVKWRKQQKGRMTGLSKGATSVAFGEFGLQALSCGFVTSRQIEAARIAISRHVKRGGKLYIRIFPDKPISKKPAETRMGHGKGNPEEWVAVVRPGRTTATHSSGFPLPWPIRVSAGFFEIGLSGKIRM